MSTFFRAFPRQWNANYVWSLCHILRPVPYNTGNSSAQCAICPKMKRGQKKKNRKSIRIDSTCNHSVSVDTLLYTKNVQRNKFDWSIYVCSAFDTIFCRLCGSFINVWFGFDDYDIDFSWNFLHSWRGAAAATISEDCQFFRFSFYFDHFVIIINNMIVIVCDVRHSSTQIHEHITKTMSSMSQPKWRNGSVHWK